MARARILIVEDERIVAFDIKTRLEKMGYAVTAVTSSAEEAVQQAAKTRPDLVLMDIKLNGEVDGVEAAREIRARFDIPVVYLTAFADEATVQRAKVAEPFGYLLKPFEERELHSTLEIALYKHATERMLKENEQRLATTLNSIGDAVITTDAEGRIQSLNPIAEQLTGWSQEQAYGKDLTKVLQFKVEGSGQRDNLVETALRQDMPVVIPNDTLLVNDGSEMFIDGNIAPITDDKGARIGTVLVFRDVTKRVRADRLLQRLNQAALAIEKALTHDEIFSAVSQEFRKLGFSCVILLLDEDRSHLRIKYLSFEARLLETAEKLVGFSREEFSFPVENTVLFRESISERKAVFIENAVDLAEGLLPQRAKRFAGKLVELLKMSKVICAPLNADNEVVGVLSVQSDDLREADQSAITAFANQVSAAWHKAQMFEQAQLEIAERVRAEEEIQLRSRELVLLNQIIVASGELEPETLLERACRELARFLDVPYVAATLLGRDRREAVVVAEYVAEGRPSALKQKISVQDDPPFQYLLSYRAPLVTPTSRLARSRGAANLETEGENVLNSHQRNASLIHFPLLIEGEVAGSLDLEPRVDRSFSAREISLVWSVADQVASALARARLDEDRRRLTTAIEQATESVMITDTEGAILYVNPAFEQVTGYPSGEVIGRNPRLLKSGEQDPGMYEDLWQTISAKRPWHGLLVNRKKDGSLYTVDTTISPVRDEFGEIVNYIGLQRDITHELQLEEQYRQAQKDTLTGLPNRALFMDRLESSIQRARHIRDYQFAVLFLDLDRFKVINDSLGHVIGDQLLVAVARRLEECVRSDDMVGRFGGDEFAILLDNIQGLKQAVRVANRIQKKVAQPVTLKGRRVFTGASIGIAMSGTGYSRPVDYLRNADTAMYRAKALGRARCEVFDTSMYAQAVARWQLETDLHQAVERHEFQLYYQPFVSLTSGKIVGVEALLRWQHPVRGLVTPSEFISLAEETGLIAPIGEWVLRTACAQTRTWHLAGYQELRVAVNVSAYQFQDRYLTALVKEVLRETDLPPHTLELEITEGVAIRDGGYAILDEISALGVRVSLDDFGLGSSLDCLKRFPLNTLKIDQSFVSGMIRDAHDETIITAIIEMAHNLDLEVIAEGVEKEDQLSFLRSKQCDQVQGNLFSQPVPVDALTDLLAEGRSSYS